MAACMSVFRRSRLFGDFATYCRIEAARTYIKRAKADIPKPKFNKDKEGNKIGVCVVPFPLVLDIDPVVEDACENPLRDLKTHRGIMTAKPAPLPQLMAYNARLLLAQKQLLNNRVLERDVQRLHDVFKCRQPPMEKKTIDRDMKQIFESNYTELLERGIDPKKLDEKRKRQIENKSLTSFYRTHHKWSKMGFDENSSLLYMATRLAPNYKVLYQIFYEIQKRDRRFLPTSIYNLGSGLGTVVWAADAIWGKKVLEYYNVDESPTMNELAKKLLAHDMDTLASSIKGVYFRQFPLSDSSNSGSFKMVVSAYTLMDQPNRLARLSLVDSLLNLTEEYLVLVEHGTTAGHRLIMEARDFLLKNQGRKRASDVACHVFAPCTHDLVCPRLELHKAPCYFTTEYKPLNTGKEFGQGLRNQTDMYTYVVIKKGARKTEVHSYPRMLSVVKKQGYSECEMCCRDGTTRAYVISKSKPSKMVHLACRKSACGDFLPVNWPTDDEMKAYEMDPPEARSDDDTVDGVLDENVDGVLDDTVNGMLDDTVDGVLEDTVDGMLDDTVDSVLAGGVSESTTGEVTGISQDGMPVVDDTVTEGIDAPSGEHEDKVANEFVHEAIGKFVEYEERMGLIDDDFDSKYEESVDDSEYVADTDAVNKTTQTFEEMIQEAEKGKESEIK